MHHPGINKASLCQAYLRIFNTNTTSNNGHPAASTAHTSILTMSQFPPASYPLSSSPFYSSAIPMMNPALNTDTPPPPPPKPGSHEASQGGTPQMNPAVPSQVSQEGYQTQNSQSFQHQIDAPLPKPPTVEEGWLPDVVRDKS